MPFDQAKQTKIVKLYSKLKYISLLAEEFDSEGFKSFLQPFNEQRHALDHLMRAAAADLGLIQGADAQVYVGQQQGKAIGHLYRGFFDAADWLGILLRERIINELRWLHPDDIQAAIPDYYHRIRPLAERAALEVAGLRDGKDIEKTDEAMIAEVEQYHQLLTDLTASWGEIVERMSALRDLDSQRRRREKHEKRSQWGRGVALVLLGIALTLLIKRWWG